MFTRGKKLKKSKQNYYIINTVNNLNLVIKPGESFPNLSYQICGIHRTPNGFKISFFPIHFH